MTYTAQNPEAKQPRLIGYSRVSTPDQSLAMQTDALAAAGCDRVFQDAGISGATSDRSGLQKALASLAQGDTLIVWKLDRLSRSLTDTIALLDDLTRRGIAFRSLTEPMLDSTSAVGRMVVQLFAVLAECERNLARERTKAGLAAAKKRGAKLGRPQRLTHDQLAHARQLIASGNEKRAVARLLGVDPATLRRRLSA
jgi:DNA invertase Pin-like site-specific DNA recombinase